jgi:hypothetical protein
MFGTGKRNAAFSNPSPPPKRAAPIKAGLDSGATGPLDVAEIKAEARSKRRAARDAR